jgi:hypothetical protein
MGSRACIDRSVGIAPHHHLRQGNRIQAEIVERPEQAARRGVPAKLVRGRDRDLTCDLIELAIEVETQDTKVLVHPDPVPGRHRRRPTGADSIHEEHVRGPADTDRGVDQAQ